MVDNLVLLVVLGIASGTASFTIAKTKITQPIREAVGKRSKWLGMLLACPYCISHWLALIAVALYQPRIAHLTFVLDMGLTWLVTVFIAALTWGYIMAQMKRLAP